MSGVARAGGSMMGRVVAAGAIPVDPISHKPLKDFNASLNDLNRFMRSRDSSGAYNVKIGQQGQDTLAHLKTFLGKNGAKLSETDKAELSRLTENIRKTAQEAGFAEFVESLSPREQAAGPASPPPASGGPQGSGASPHPTAPIPTNSGWSVASVLDTSDALGGNSLADIKESLTVAINSPQINLNKAKKKQLTDALSKVETWDNLIAVLEQLKNDLPNLSSNINALIQNIRTAAAAPSAPQQAPAPAAPPPPAADQPGGPTVEGGQPNGMEGSTDHSSDDGGLDNAARLVDN